MCMKGALAFTLPAGLAACFASTHTDGEVPEVLADIANLHQHNNTTAAAQDSVGGGMYVSLAISCGIKH